MEYFTRRFDFPARYTFTIWCTLGYALSYTMRANLSVALVAMVRNPVNITRGDNSSSLACPELFHGFQNYTPFSKTQIHGEFDWDRRTQSMLLGAFFYGYIASVFACGILADRWKAKWSFGLGILLSSIITLLSPIIAEWNVHVLVGVRVIQGVVQGAVYPSIHTMIGRWAPIMERSRISAVIHSGNCIGNVVGFTLSGFLCKSNFLGGWPSAFYVFGALSCIWFVFWAYLVYEWPENHPRISASELSYITKNKVNVKFPSIPWISILTSVPVWALAISQFGHGWSFYTLMTEMPTFLSNILHFSIEKNGLLSSIPYISQALVGVLSSYIADEVRKREKFSITTIRKIFNSMGFFTPGLCLVLVIFVGCRPTIAVILLSMTLGLSGINNSGFKVTHVDMSPQFAGFVNGAASTIGNLSGILAPYVAGKITGKEDTFHSWGIVFGIAAGMYFVTGIIYDVFASAELQSWSKSNDMTETNTAIKLKESAQKAS